MNSIWPSAVTVSNSSRANNPFSPTSMNTPSSGLPRSHHGCASGRKACDTGTGSGQSTRGIALPLLRIGPNPISRHPIVAVGLISTVAGKPGVRPSRNSNNDCAPATADLASSMRLGRSSEWVYGMLKPMPPVPLVPTFTYALVSARRSASTRICTCRISCGVVSSSTCRSTAARSSVPAPASASSSCALFTTS